MMLSVILRATWAWNLGLLLAALAASGAFQRVLGGRRGGAHWGPWIAGVSLIALALSSPVNALAEGCLFSAHMAQHLILLLIAPALLLFSLPSTVAGPGWARRGVWPLAAWLGGVGAMWLWHVPALCDAAAASHGIEAAQSLSLLAMGLLFWWPIFAPSAADRLRPWAGMAYLFAACLACTALGVLLTLTPIEVCPVFRAPPDRFALLPTIRQVWGISAARDRAFGGLLMWIPMCTLYVGAILFELARWYGEKPAKPAEAMP
jgi:cytochrome c oxidase assembly factor CtaG